MGLYKICEHKGRARDRCEHTWWGSFRGVRVSLAKWANREVDNKATPYAALDDLKRAIRNGTFDERGLEPPRDVTTLTFREFAEIYNSGTSAPSAWPWHARSIVGSGRWSTGSAIAAPGHQNCRH